MDIGTKATRMLISDVETFIKKGFLWEDFTNRGTLTFLGNALNQDGYIEEQGIKKTVDAMIDFRMEAERKFNVRQFHAIGTGVFRLAKNGKQIVQLIKKYTGIEILILTKEKEAEFSLLAAMTTNTENIQSGDVGMLIDQGGGSTEIAFGEFDKNKKLKILSLESLNIGTVTLKQRLFKYLGKDIDITFCDAFNALVQESEEEIRACKKFDCGNKSIKAFGVGNGITGMTRKKGNKNQHGIILSIDKMNKIADRILNESGAFLSWKLSPGVDDDYPEGIRSKLKDIQRLDQDNPDLIETELSILFGRIGYSELLKYYNVDNISVCGTGLRYGIFFALALYKFNKDK